MKKIFFVVTLMLTALVSRAQITFDVRVGANVSGIENSDTQMKWGLKAGAGIDCSVAKAFSVRPMVFYTSKGSTVGKNNLGFSPDKTMSLDYIQLPVFASYHFKITNGFMLTANAGPYAAYLINKKSTGAVKYNKFDAGITAGIDFVFNHFVVGIDAEYGLSSLSSDVDKLHNINYSLAIGFKF